MRMLYRAELCGRILVDGARDRIRTCDPRITNAVLYQLSYTGKFDKKT